MDIFWNRTLCTTEGGSWDTSNKGMVGLNIMFLFWLKSGILKIFNEFSEPKWYAGEDVVF